MTEEKIEKLTPEQEAMLPVWRDKWTAIGLRTGETDWATFDKYMPICYQKAGLKYPKNVVRVSSPLVGALMASIAREILGRMGKMGWKKMGWRARDAVAENVVKSVGDAVESVVENVVGSVAKNVILKEVRERVLSVVVDALENVVLIAMLKEIMEGDVVGDVVGDEVEAAMINRVANAVSGAVGDAVENRVANVTNAVMDVVGDMKHIVREVVEEALKKMNLRWHYWLGGQFWVSSYGRGSPAIVSFFTDVCGLKFSKDIMERAEAYRKVCESVNFIWPNSDFVVVCARPKKINLNVNNQLHSDTEKSIEYPDGWGLYCLNGVWFPEELWKKVVSRKMPFEEILKIENIDQRTQAMRYGDAREFLRYTKSIKLDSYENWGTIYELWKIPQEAAVFSVDAYYLLYTDPKTGKQYMSGIEPEIGKRGKAKDALAWKRNLKASDLMRTFYA